MDEIKVILADGTEHYFPAGTDDAIIDAKVKEIISGQGRMATQQEDESFLGGVGRQLMELPSGLNRAATEFADVALSPLIAAERQIRPYAQAAMGMRDMPESAQAAYRETKPFSFREDLPIEERGAFGGEGLATDILGGVGEAIPTTAAMAYGGPALLARSPALQRTGTTINNLRQAGREMLRTTPQQEALFGTASVAGQEVGEKFGGEETGLVASFLAPIGTSVGVSGIRAGKNLLNEIFSNIGSANQMALSLGSIQDDLAAEILADGMVAEGVTTEQLIQKLNALGPDAMPADLNESFRSILRAATNMNPALRGQAKTSIYNRAEGTAARVQNDIDAVLDAPDITPEEAIEQLNKIMQPEIQKLYAEAGETALQISPRVRALLEGDNTIGRSQNKVQRRLSDMRASGQDISHFDLINVSKQELDDQITSAIRKGDNNKARTLINLRNQLISEADRTMPTYKQARDLFAGKVELENAARYGEQIFKMPAYQVKQLVEGLSTSEKNMFVIGARRAIFNQIDNAQVTADLVKKLFGRNGDVQKLRSLMPSNDAFEKFKQSMKREAEFILTRNTALGNSMTIAQKEDLGGLKKAVSRVASIFLGGAQSRAIALTDIADGLSADAGSAKFRAALNRAGEILLTQGMRPEKVRALLSKPESKAFSDAIALALKFNQSPITSRLSSQAVRSSAAAQTTGDE